MDSFSFTDGWINTYVYDTKWLLSKFVEFSTNTCWVTQKLPQICTVILRIRIGRGCVILFNLDSSDDKI